MIPDGALNFSSCLSWGVSWWRQFTIRVRVRLRILDLHVVCVLLNAVQHDQIAFQLVIQRPEIDTRQEACQIYLGALGTLS